MYDTVVLKLLKEDIGDKYDWRSVFNKIDQISEYKPFEGGSGHINGLRVTRYCNGKTRQSQWEPL